MTMYDIDKIGKNFGKALRLLRNQRKMSQWVFAESCDMAPSQICYLETGKRHPDFFSIMKICNGLNITADELLKLSETKGENNEL